jgi:transcription-repair coupling factor (superfamily II helicase)
MIEKISIVNLSAAAHYFLSRYKNDRNLIFILEEDNEAEEAAKIFETINQNIFKLNIEIIIFNLEKDRQIQAIEKIYSNENKKFILITSREAIKNKVISKNKWAKSKFILKAGEKISRNTIIDKLAESGYSRVSFIENVNEFAVRGSVIDYYNPAYDFPVRLYLTERIEEIKTFEISTQKTIDSLEEAQIYDIKSNEVSILNILDFLIITYKLKEKIETENNAIVEIEDNPEYLIADYIENIKFGYDISLIKKEMERFKKENYKIDIFCRNQKELLNIDDFFYNNKINVKLNFNIGDINKGFYNKTEKLAIISSNELFAKAGFREFKAPIKRIKNFKFSDLNIGDYVVHENYGIGRYMGVRKIYDNQIETDCLEIEYARGDKLLVPLYEFKRIQKYLGSNGKTPKLSHMDNKSWEQTKERVKKEIQIVAKELIKLEASRALIRLKPMMDSGELEKKFKEEFVYEETPDQRKAIEDALADLEKDRPTNRVVVGDVGFGKTEVAMRAAMRVVSNNFQVCLLCPTTILAEQHYNTFKKRFEGFPVNIECLSRLTPRSKVKKILEGIKSGVIDIVIGTHKLIRKNINFPKLRLLVIDEEHKFGVKDKEKLKEIYKNIHVLTLSATPIPRTLYQSLSDLRSISVIESPPIGRLPVYTKVSVYNEKTIKEAIESEINREGQIYYVYNRVEFIESKKAKLQKLMPYLKIAVIHGQMSSDRIERAMEDFLSKKYDMLLASTIIESGLDIPSVNTLIVEDAHLLGLAQLYQLRGRIGREKKKAYCYLFFPEYYHKGEISSESVKRLMALQEFSELGSGFRLAMRDLEIRGSGELLGAKQHGFINSIGIELYIKILNEEIRKIKGKKTEEEIETSVDLKLPAFIPLDYIEDDMERLNYYKKILNASNKNEMDNILLELKDICGQIPYELNNLSRIVLYKKRLSAIYVKSVFEKDENIEIFFYKGAKIAENKIIKWQNLFKGRIRFISNPSGDGMIIDKGDLDVFDIMEKVLT